MHRIFLEHPVEGQCVAIDSQKEVHHLATVLRASPGDLFEVCDSRGRLYRVALKQIGREGATGDVVEVLGEKEETGFYIDLFQAVPKKNNMDLVIQKNTELGVRRFRPFMSSRTVVRIDPRNEDKKTERWRRIALEAAKQSKRTTVPDVCPVAAFKEILPELEAYERVVLLYENASGAGLEVLETQAGPTTGVALVVGPEGGFSGGEVSALQQAGALAITLGSRILRTETAGFAAVSILQYLFGDLRGGDRP